MNVKYFFETFIDLQNIFCGGLSQVIPLVKGLGLNVYPFSKTSTYFFGSRMLLSSMTF